MTGRAFLLSSSVPPLRQALVDDFHYIQLLLTSDTSPPQSLTGLESKMSTYATHSHIVPVAHPVFFILRIAQLVLAVALLGLLAYLAYVYNNVVGSVTTVYSGAIGVGLFSVSGLSQAICLELR